MNTIIRKNVNTFLNKLNGKIFTAEFIKKNYEYRIINCRLHVKKYLRGGTLKYSPKEKHLISVFDVKKLSYRMINLDTLVSIKFNNKLYLIVD